MSPPQKWLFKFPGSFGDQAEVRELVGELEQYKGPGVMAIGPVGAGKSSFLNTIASYVSSSPPKRLELLAAAGKGTRRRSITHDSAAHAINFRGTPVNWKWLDTPGDVFEELHALWRRTKLDAGDELHVSQGAYTQHIERSIIEPMLRNHLGCVIAFLPASDMQQVKKGRPQPPRPGHVKAVKDLYQRLSRRGLRMMCVLTKVDLVDSTVCDNVSNVVFSSEVSKLRSLASQWTGFPVNQVLPAVNLVHEWSPQGNLPLGHLALFTLDIALSAARHSSAARQLHLEDSSGISAAASDADLKGGAHAQEGAEERLSIEASQLVAMRARFKQQWDDHQWDGQQWDDQQWDGQQWDDQQSLHSYNACPQQPRDDEDWEILATSSLSDV